MDKIEQFGRGNITLLLLKFSIPATIGMMVSSLYNVVDRIFIGRGVGTDAIAGITVAYPIPILFMSFGLLIGYGATASISIRLGEGNRKRAEQIMGNAFLLLLGVSVILSILGLMFLEPMMALFGASEAVMPYSVDYMTIILLGAPIMGIGFGMNNMIRADGSPRTAMVTMIIGAVVNIILDYIFIFPLDMGIKGAAYATILAQVISAIWVMNYFRKGSTLKLRLKNLRVKLDILKNIAAMGSPQFIMQIVGVLMIIILNKSLYHYGGDEAIAAMGIIMAFSMFMIMPVIGLSQGAQPIIGYNFGAGKYDRVRSTLLRANVTATVIVIITFAIAQLFPEQIISFVNPDDQGLIDMGSRGLRIFLAALPIIGFQIISSHYFQSVGKPRKSIMLNLLRQLILFIPAMLIFPLFLGLDGIFWAGPFSDVGAAVLIGIFLYFEMRHLGKNGNGKEIKG